MYQLALILCIISTQALADESKKINYHALNQALFSFVYKENGWGCEESRSGTGSTLKETSTLRAELPKLLRRINAHIMIDAACGDFNWMKTVDLSMLHLYIGLDIVPEMIAQNIERYGANNRLFFTVDIASFPLPRADVVMCRDCIQHLPDENIFAIIRNIKKSKSTYLLMSNQEDIEENRNMTGKLVYQPLRLSFRNLFLKPFSFPKPMFAIDEGLNDKKLCLWRVEDLPDF